MKPARAPLLLRGLGAACVLSLVGLGPDPLGRASGAAPAGAASGAALGPVTDASPAGWAVALAAPAPPGVVVRRLPDAPDADELDALAALAARAPLAVELPPGPAAGPTIAPAGPLAAGRRGALRLSVPGAPGDTVEVRLSDGAGGADSARVAIAPEGLGVASVGVRPASAGWRTWTARAGGREATAGAWVEEAGPVRVALYGGAGGWEARYAARALEEAGAEVAVHLALGRGRAVESAEPASDSADAFLVLPGASLSAATSEAIVERVRAGGAGALLVGTDEPSLARALGLPERAERVTAPTARSLPADLEPLPPAPARALLATRPQRGALVGARADALAALLLRPAGLGRAAWSGVADTWRWRLERGAQEAHRAYWEALAHWLGAGRLAGARYRFTPQPLRRGELALALGAVAGEASLRGPDGTPVPAGAFVPADTAAYLLVDRSGATLTGARAPDAPVVHPWGRAALLAHGSGGVALPAPALDEWLAARGAGVPPRRALAWLLLAAAFACALSAWGLDRYRGAP